MACDLGGRAMTASSSEMKHNGAHCGGFARITSELTHIHEIVVGYKA